jgi:serine/threonine protein kinase
MDSIIAKRIETGLLGREIAGWKITGRLDSGKSAVVFRASRDSEAAAIKIFDPEMVERYGKNVQLARIERELRLKGKHHPNLIKILDGGECNSTGYLFVAMELIDAPNLASVLSTVPADRIWGLISQIAGAARFLEDLELVHRDIKPGNIVISRDFQQAVLLDLGVLRPFGVTGLTDEEQRKFVGTLQYSPPEFLVREEEDSPEGWRAITFYQLGAVLHDFIMKEPIFVEQSEPYGLLARAVERINPKIQSTEVPPDLVVLAASCLQKDPKLRLDLVKWEDFDPPQLRGDSPLDDAKSRIRRRRAIAQQSSSVGNEISPEQQARSARRTLEKLQAALQNGMQQECIGSELFPQLEIHDAAPTGFTAGRFKVQFCASEDHALSEMLSIFVSLELLDEHSEAVRISYAGAVSKAAVDWPSLKPSYSQELFKGVYNQPSVDAKLKQVLYELLDKAQQVQRRSADSGSMPIWLTDVLRGEVKE